MHRSYHLYNRTESQSAGYPESRRGAPTCCNRPLQRAFSFEPHPPDPGKTGSEVVKRILKIGAIAAAVLLVVLIAVPFVINVNSFHPKIASETTTALGRQVTVGNLSLSILSGSVVAHNIAIADDPAFSKAPFITAKSLKVGVELMPLIFSKQLNITEIKLDHPDITLLKAGNGKWNFSSIGGASAQRAPEEAKSGGTSNLAVAKLNVSNGKLIVGKANSSAKSQ